MLIYVLGTRTATARRADATHLEPERMRDMIAAARKQEKPYILDSVIFYIRLEDAAGPPGSERRAFVRAVYNVRALRDIQSAEDVFLEQFSSSVSTAPPEHWFGNRREIFKNVNGSIYSVNVEARNGDRFTVVTGANLTYQLPLPAGRPVPGEVARLAGNEDYWYYPNREDFIGELVVILESPTTVLRPLERGAVRITNNQPHLSDVSVGERASSVPRQRTLSAAWYDVRPTEGAGILYTW